MPRVAAMPTERGNGATAAAPLKGVRVVELAHIAAGPFAGSLLADLGADVVKVEPPGGEAMRSWPPFVSGPGGSPISANFAALNRNKRGLVANLKDSTEAERLRELCDEADVVLENFRPGALARLGLDALALRARNPGLVYCSISGFGSTGPDASRAAFDVTVQAASGLMSVTGEPGRDAAKCGVPVGDFVTGLYAALSIVSCLHRRAESGEGATIECSMLGSLLGVSALQTSEFFGSGQIPQPLGTAHPRNAPYQAFPTADRPIVVAAGTDRMWQRLCDVIGRPQLTTDPRFVDQRRRVINQVELADELTSVFVKRGAQDWHSALERAGVANSLVLDYSEALATPQVEHLELVADVRLSNGGDLTMVAMPVSIDGTLAIIECGPPALPSESESDDVQWRAAKRA